MATYYSLAFELTVAVLMLIAWLIINDRNNDDDF